MGPFQLVFNVIFVDVIRVLCDISMRPFRFAFNHLSWGRFGQHHDSWGRFGEAVSACPSFSGAVMGWGCFGWGRFGWDRFGYELLWGHLGWGRFGVGPFWPVTVSMSPVLWNWYILTSRPVRIATFLQFNPVENLTASFPGLLAAMIITIYYKFVIIIIYYKFG